MTSNVSFLVFLAYVVLSPFAAAAAFGSDTAYDVVLALNFGLTLGWSFGAGAIKFEIGFPSAAKPIAVPTAFSVEGIAGVEKGYIAASESPFAPLCTDPATCGSEWTAGLDIGSPTVAVMCSRCGRSGHLDAGTSVEFRAAAA